jgi:hypothetical protein
MKILEFIEIFYDCTVVLSGVYYPTNPLVLHQMLEMTTHLQECEKDPNMFHIVYPMKL